MPPPAPPTLPDFLAHNQAHCPACHYQLQGSTSPNCPECGTELALGVIQPPRPLGPWTFITIALAMGIGFDLVAMTLMTIPAIFSGQAWFFFFPMGLLFTGALTCAGGIYTLFRYHRRWFALPRRRQWSITISTYVVVFVLHLALAGAIGLVF